jgi:hypothetical protein
MKRLGTRPFPALGGALLLLLLPGCGDELVLTQPPSTTASTAASTGAGGSPAATAGTSGPGSGGAGGEAPDPCPAANGNDPDADLDRHVDPLFGSDACPGSQQAPWKTITHALSRATAGRTVHLAGGTYTYDSQRGEDFSAPVPEGVTLTADLGGEAILLGEGADTGLAFLGSGAASHLRLQGFGAGIVAKTGEITLSAIKLVDDGCGLRLTGNVHANMSDALITGGMVGIELHNGASLDLSDGEMSGIGPACVLGSRILGLYNAASARLGAVKVHDSFGLLELHNASSLEITGSPIARVGAAGCGLGATIQVGDASSLVMHDTTIGEGQGPAVYAHSAGAQVEISGGSIQVHGTHGLALGVASASIDGTSLSGDGGGYGIDLDFGTLHLSHAAITHFQVGLHQAGGTTTMRDSAVSGGSFGVLYLGGGLDLGTLAEPGKNLLQGNSDTALYVGSAENVSLSAVGNGWEASVQGVSYLGVFGSHGTMLGPLGLGAPLPRNFVITGAGPSVTY